MILVFGGTTEGMQVVEMLETLQLPYLYSTKTEIPIVPKKMMAYRFGALNREELQELIVKKKIKTIINAAHPFASELHETIAKSVNNKIGVLRLERTYPKRVKDKLVQYVNNYEEVVYLLEDYKTKTLLALSGVQSIEKLKSHWERSKTYFRILDRKSSIELARETNFPEEQLILGLPNKTVREEYDLVKEYGIGVMLTKESGDSGLLSIKIKTALQRGIPIIIIKRPALPKAFQLMSNIQELQNELIHQLAKKI